MGRRLRLLTIMAEPLIVSSGPAAVETADKGHCGMLVNIGARNIPSYSPPRLVVEDSSRNTHARLAMLPTVL